MTRTLELGGDGDERRDGRRDARVEWDQESREEVRWERGPKFWERRDERSVGRCQNRI